MNPKNAVDAPVQHSEAQLQARVLMARAVADAIRELGSVPSGHLYARLMGVLSLDAYEQIIGALISAGVVRRDGSHLLTWIGK